MDGEETDGPLLDGIHLVAIDLELVVDDVKGEGKADPLQCGVAGQRVRSRAEPGQEEAGGRGDGGGSVGVARGGHGGEWEGGMMT